MFLYNFYWIFVIEYSKLNETYEMSLPVWSYGCWKPPGIVGEAILSKYYAEKSFWIESKVNTFHRLVDKILMTGERESSPPVVWKDILINNFEVWVNYDILYRSRMKMGLP